MILRRMSTPAILAAFISVTAFVSTDCVIAAGGRPDVDNEEARTRAQREQREEDYRRDREFTREREDRRDRETRRDGTYSREQEERRERESRRGGDFSENERKTIRDYFRSGDTTGGLPPGLAKRERLPPGLERQLHRNGTLPPGLQRHALPDDLERRLSIIKKGQSRFLTGDKVLLLDEETQTILDIIDLIL